MEEFYDFLPVANMLLGLLLVEDKPVMKKLYRKNLVKHFF